jgi:hypothetical protein
MTTEKMDKQAIHIFSEKVAFELGSDWTVDFDDEGYVKYIKSLTSNAKLYLSQRYGTKSTHVTIGGSLHVGRDGSYVEVYAKGTDGTGWHRQNVGEITVAISRGPATIAKEITRRFLPDYLRILTLANAKVASDIAYETDVRLNLKRLAKAADTTVTFDDANRWDKREAFSLSIGEVYGTVHASNKTATLELRSLPIKQAEEVLRLVMRLHTDALLQDQGIVGDV